MMVNNWPIGNFFMTLTAICLSETVLRFFTLIRFFSTEKWQTLKILCWNGKEEKKEREI